MLEDLHDSMLRSESNNSISNDDALIGNNGNTLMKRDNNALVIFVHGFTFYPFETGSTFPPHFIRDYMGSVRHINKYYKIFSHTSDTSLDDDATRLVRFIKQYHRDNQDIILVGHSLGGLICLRSAAKIQPFINCSIKKIITIDSPLYGCNNSLINYGLIVALLLMSVLIIKVSSSLSRMSLSVIAPWLIKKYIYSTYSFGLPDVVSRSSNATYSTYICPCNMINIYQENSNGITFVRRPMLSTGESILYQDGLMFKDFSVHDTTHPFAATHRVIPAYSHGDYASLCNTSIIGPIRAHTNMFNRGDDDYTNDATKSYQMLLNAMI